MADIGTKDNRRPTRFTKPLEMLRRFPLTLALSATMSVIFVLFVGALIAFMQYQARLSRAQPGITASQLVYYVETEKNIETELDALGKLSKEISADTPTFTYTSNEINFRIDRICALFNSGQDAKKDTEKCREFLNQIPFNAKDTVPEARLDPTPNPADSAAAKKVVPEEPISEEVLSDIMDNFVEIMGARKFGNVESSKLVKQFSADMNTIARLNQSYSLKIRPQYLYKVHQYSANCQHLNQLIAIVSTYRTINSGCTPELENSIAAPGGNDNARPAEGGAIQGAPTGGAIQTPQMPPADRRGAAPTPAGTVGLPLAPPIGAQPPITPPAPSGSPGIFDTQPQKSPLAGDVIKTGSNLLSAPAMSAIDRQRAFELVTHYRFYDRLSSGKLKDILISPNDFLALVLVCVAGILGALLRIVFASYISGKDPTMRSVVISPILGLICSLVIYNLFRAGFIVITDQPQSGDTAMLSPFVIALLAMAGGLLSERTIEYFRKTSDKWLGSVEASQADRWAVNLQREMDAQATTAEKLAERLDVSAGKLKDWAQEKEAVPMDKQRDIAFALNLPVRRLFTDIEPVRNA